MDYLVVVLDAFLGESETLEGTPNQVHRALQQAVQAAACDEVFQSLDFGPHGSPTFSHGLAAAISNLQSFGAIERTNPKLTVFKRGSSELLHTYAEEVKAALSPDQAEALSVIVREFRRNLAEVSREVQVFTN